MRVAERAMAPVGRSLKCRRCSGYTAIQCVKSVLIPLASLIGVACNSIDRTASADQSKRSSAWESVPPNERVEITSPTWVLRDSLIGEPRRLLATRDYLWIVDIGDPFLHAIDIATGSIRFSRVRRGTGPGELSGIPSIGPWDSTGRIWLADIQARRLVVVGSDLDDSSETLAIVPSEGNRRAVRFGGDSGSLWSVTLGQDGVYPRRLEVVEDSGSKSVRLDARESVFPVASLELPKKQLRDLLLQGSLCVAPSEGSAAYAPFGEGMLFMLTGRSEEWRWIDAPVPSRPEVIRDSSARYTPSRHYYIGCAWSRDHLYLLFSGGVIGSLGDDPSAVGREVHVLSRSGELSRVIRLPQAVSSLSVDELGETLFTISGERDAVVAYRIPRR